MPFCVQWFEMRFVIRFSDISVSFDHHSLLFFSQNLKKSKTIEKTNNKTEIPLKIKISLKFGMLDTTLCD